MAATSAAIFFATLNMPGRRIRVRSAVKSVITSGITLFCYSSSPLLRSLVVWGRALPIAVSQDCIDIFLQHPVAQASCIVQDHVGVQLNNPIIILQESIFAQIMHGMLRAFVVPGVARHVHSDWIQPPNDSSEFGWRLQICHVEED